VAIWGFFSDAPMRASKVHQSSVPSPPCREQQHLFAFAAWPREYVKEQVHHPAGDGPVRALLRLQALDERGGFGELGPDLVGFIDLLADLAKLIRCFRLRSFGGP
jgi:hypothetical protein